MKKLLTATAATALLASGAFAGSHSENIKIGVILGFTGPIESLTPHMAAGAELAMSEVNESGALLGGATVESVRADSTCIDAAATLAEQQITARVVSMPCVETFLQQDKATREALLPPGTPRLTVEAATTMGWGRITAGNGDSFGIDRFGASAPCKVLAEQFGFTAGNIAERAKALVR